MEGLTAALWSAMLEGEYNMANKLIFSGANVNEPRNTDIDPVTTLLHYATNMKNVQLMRLLIKHGANCNARDSENRTPLHLAATFDDRPDVVEVLINEGAVVDARDVNHLTPFLLSVMYNCYQTAEMLIVRGASIEAVSEWGWSALHFMAVDKDLRMIKMLISHKVNINAEDDSGYTPLHYAAFQGITDIACLLLDNGADLHRKENTGDCSLHLAVSRNHPATVHSFLKRGARINVVNDAGDTPLHKAIQYKFEDVAALLVKFGANMNVPNHNGKTALQLLLPNTPSIEAIARIIIREVVKREASGQPICEGYRQMAQSCEKYSEFDQECRLEIKRMRSETIDVEDSAVSFYYIFSKNEVKLAALARNKSIVMAFETSDYLALFRIYAVDLTTKFEKAKRHANFVMSVEDCLIDGLSDTLPVPILLKIAAYVEYDDKGEDNIFNSL